MLEPIQKTIEVPCNQKKAFEVFVHEMDSWWPLAKFTTSAMSGAPAKAIKIDLQPGGQIREISQDDTETLWGTIKEYNPYSYVSMYFHIPTPGEKVNSRSLLEITFTIITEKSTKVELKQSDWEAFGERAKDLQGGYGGGWAFIFEVSYKDACSR